GMRLLRISESADPKPKNAAAERRKARRPAEPVGHLRRLPEVEPAARARYGCGGFRTSACRRSAPLAFFREYRTGNDPRGKARRTRRTHGQTQKTWDTTRAANSPDSLPLAGESGERRRRKHGESHPTTRQIRSPPHE